MKKIILAMVFMVVIVAFVMAGGGADTGKTFVLKYNQLEPEEHPQGVTETKFAEKVE